MRRGFLARQPPPKRPARAAKCRILDLLTADEAQAVLQGLLSARPELGPEAERLAKALLATVSFKNVADNVLAAVQALDLNELDAGPHEWGYVEPSEAAWDLITKTVNPYLADLERRVQLGHEHEALEVCKGIVLGLYSAEQRGAELLAYAEDCPSETAGSAVELWRRRQRNRAFPRDFVEKFTPEWKRLVR